MKRKKAGILLGLMTAIVTAGLSIAGEAADGEAYYLLATIENKENVPLTEYAEYFSGEDTEAAIKEIVASGEVYVNNYQIPVAGEDGSVSETDYRINGEQAIWQAEDGQWGWHAQKLYAYDMPMLADMEEGFEAGAYVDFETAEYLFTKYLSALEGQTVRLYAKEGEEYASRIETMSVTSAILCAVEGEGDELVLIGTDGKPLTDAGAGELTVKAENIEGYSAGQTDIDSMIVYWRDNSYDDSWVVISADANYGTLIETEDYHKPLWKPEGSEDTFDISECLIGRTGVAEAYRHTQFIRGYRRIGEYALGDTVTMWTLPENDYLGTIGDGCIGFTRGDAARAALENGVAYAEEAVAAVDTSEIDQEIMDAYQGSLEAAKAALDDDTTKNLVMDELIIELANTLGGTEGGRNPAGVLGKAAGLE